MKTVRIGVIGTGTMGERHCRICSNLPGTELVGVIDSNEARGRMVAGQYGAEYFRDLDLLQTSVDAVVIATPTSSHYALAADCLERGLHVMVEKPITEATWQAKHLVHLAEERGLVLQVGHIERFNPAYVELKHVTQGMPIIGINIRRLSSFDSSNTDVDVIRDLMIHDLDLVTNAVDAEILNVSAWGRAIHTKETDHAVATISFKGGTIATLAASRVTEQKVRLIEVTAEGAYVEADLLNKSVQVHRRTFPQYVDTNKTTIYRQESIIERIFVPMQEPLMQEMQHFSDCVRENRPSRVSGSDGLRALELADIISSKVSAIHSNGNGSYLNHAYLPAFMGLQTTEQEQQ